MRLEERPVEGMTDRANLLGTGDTDVAKSLCLEVFPNACLARRTRTDDCNEHADVVPVEVGCFVRKNERRIFGAPDESHLLSILVSL